MFFKVHKLKFVMAQMEVKHTFVCPTELMMTERFGLNVSGCSGPTGVLLSPSYS